MKNTNKKGFTLVELVIVIAVIAILAAVLIPTFTSVINRANQSAAVQEWKAAVDEAYVEYVADYHEVPTTVKVDGKTIEFGNEKTYTDDRFVEGFVKLASGYVVLDATQSVYFNWNGENGYTVATTATGSLLNTATEAKAYVVDAVEKAFKTGAKFYKLTQDASKFVSIEFSTADVQPEGYTGAVAESLTLGTFNGKTWTLTLTIETSAATAIVSVVGA